ncbi:MAG: hypothetical protein WC795_01065 [Candidatus Paceibacterota bacterium]|jgi:CRISPR-associated endonuclease Cas2
MGNLEKEVRQRNRKANIQKIILATIYSVGMLSIALSAPKMTKLLAKFEPEFMKRQSRKYSFNRSVSRLKENGLIIFEKTPKGTFISLTGKGEAKMRQLELRDYKIKKPKRWDGKWRMLIFDIKEERKGTRDKIRRTLLQIGFIRLQDSVWIYPYDCEDLITLLKADFKIGKDVLYVIAEKIEYDKPLIEAFNLK